MKPDKLKRFLLGTALVGGLSTGVYYASQQENDQDDNDPKRKKEVTTSKPPKQAADPYGNVALFESLRSEIKFALAFVENYYPYTYYCGKAWTTGHGLTVLYSPSGKYTRVTQNTPVPSLEESDKYKGRYLTFEVLPSIKRNITRPIDRNTMIAACALRYCIGEKNFAKSAFVDQLNAGKTGKELAKTLTGWRKQSGVLNRMYFFAALLSGEIEFQDLLDLRAEGCYNLTLKDILVYKNNRPKEIRGGFYQWDFSKLPQNLEKAKQPRTVPLNCGKKGHVKVQCKLTKEIVPQYIIDDITRTKGMSNSTKVLVALGTLGALGAAARYYNHKKKMPKPNRQKHR